MQSEIVQFVKIFFKIDKTFPKVIYSQLSVIPSNVVG